jgi:hypothetical protein
MKTQDKSAIKNYFETYIGKLKYGKYSGIKWQKRDDEYYEDNKNIDIHMPVDKARKKKYDALNY